MLTTGLTPFLIAMLRTPRAALRNADPAKLAAKYGIRPEWAAWYLSDWIGRV